MSASHSRYVGPGTGRLHQTPHTRPASFFLVPTDSSNRMATDQYQQKVAIREKVRQLDRL